MCDDVKSSENHSHIHINRFSLLYFNKKTSHEQQMLVQGKELFVSLPGP